MEEVDSEKYDRLFHVYYCKFTTDVKADEITRQLLATKILK